MNFLHAMQKTHTEKLRAGNFSLLAQMHERASPTMRVRAARDGVKWRKVSLFDIVNRFYRRASAAGSNTHARLPDDGKAVRSASHGRRHKPPVEGCQVSIMLKREREEIAVCDLRKAQQAGQIEGFVI